MKRWLLQEIFLRHKLEWGAVCLLFVVMLFVSENVAVPDSEGELLLNEWISEQKDASVEEQYAFYEEQLHEISVISEKTPLSLSDYNQLYRMNYASDCYKTLWNRSAASFAVRDFAQGKTDTIWRDDLQPYLLEYPELFQTFPVCRLMNDKYLNQLLEMQKINFLFITAVVICVGIWGAYYANGIDRQEAISPNGKKMRVRRHVVLLTICEGLAILLVVLQVFLSGLSGQTNFWDSSVRIADDLQHSLTSMDIQTFLLAGLFLQMVNQLIWYLISYCLLRRNRSVKKTYIIVVSIGIALYYAGNLLEIYQKDSLLLIGYYDLGQVLRNAVPVTGTVTTFEIGVCLAAAAAAALIFTACHGQQLFFRRNRNE